MTEKQLSFIRSLLERKSFTQADADELACRIELQSGKVRGCVIDLNNLENINTSTASKLIDALIKAPSKEAAEARDARREAAFDRYKKMVEWARDRGFEIRDRTKAETVRKKIIDGGFALPEEFQTRGY